MRCCRRKLHNHHLLQVPRYQIQFASWMLNDFGFFFPSYLLLRPVLDDRFLVSKFRRCSVLIMSNTKMIVLKFERLSGNVFWCEQKSSSKRIIKIFVIISKIFNFPILSCYVTQLHTSPWTDALSFSPTHKPQKSLTNGLRFRDKQI